MATMSRRPLAAVQALEAMQQQDRQSRGEPELPYDHRASLREALQMQRTSDLLDQGGLDMAIAKAGSIDEGIDEDVERRLRLWGLDDPTQWSRYERPDVVWKFADICGRIESLTASYQEQQASSGNLVQPVTSGTANWRLREPPVVGTMATGVVNVQTQRAPTGELLILVDNGFPQFALLLAQMTTFALYDQRATGKYSEATIQLMSDIVALQSVVFTSLGAYPRKIPENVQSAVYSFEDAIQVFVIAHEYAHILNGDMDFHPMGSTPVQDSSRHAKELLADGKAFIIAMGAAQNYGMTGSGIIGPAIYLAGLDVLARAEAAYAHQTSVKYDPNYPEPPKRMERMLADIQGSAVERTFEQQLRLAIECYDTILNIGEFVMPALWAARDELIQYTPRGNEPRYPDLMALSHAAVETLWRYVRPQLH